MKWFLITGYTSLMVLGLGCPLQVVVCMVGQVEVEAVFPDVDDVGGVCVCVCVYLGVLGCYQICDT